MAFRKYFDFTTHLILISCLVTFTTPRKIETPFYEGERNYYIDENLDKYYAFGVGNEIATAFDEKVNPKGFQYSIKLSNYDMFKGKGFSCKGVKDTNDLEFSRSKRSLHTKICKAKETVHGGWSPWSTVGSHCNATCGGGKMFRIRSCTKPIPQVLVSLFTLTSASCLKEYVFYII